MLRVGTSFEGTRWHPRAWLGYSHPSSPALSSVQQSSFPPSICRQRELDHGETRPEPPSVLLCRSPRDPKCWRAPRSPTASLCCFVLTWDLAARDQAHCHSTQSKASSLPPAGCFLIFEQKFPASLKIPLFKTPQTPPLGILSLLLMRRVGSRGGSLCPCIPVGPY